jgi:cytochrome c-type biogenesis protein CcmH
MTWFALVAIALAGAAVLFLVVPLLRPRRVSAASQRGANISIFRDQAGELERDLHSGALGAAQFSQARAELEQRLLDELPGNAQPASSDVRPARRAAWTVAVALPVCAALLYLYLGNPAALTAPKRGAPEAPSITAEQFRDMTEKLASRLEKQPNDPVGWMMLGRAYKALERYTDAVHALQQAEKLEPRNADILVEYAEALALERGRTLEGEPTRLLERALQIAPDNEKALTLAGAAAFGRNDYAGAVRYWQRLVAKLPADSELARALSTGIAEAKARSAGGTPAAPSTAQREGGASKTVRGTVRLSPALATRVSPEDTLFVFARAAEGPKMPLAVLKRQVKDLPLAFELSDSMAMTPGLELSSFPRVVVGARISKSGSALAQAGDLQGQSQVVAPGAKGVLVTIDSASR